MLVCNGEPLLNLQVMISLKRTVACTMKTHLFYMKTMTKNVLFLFTLLFIVFLTYQTYGAAGVSVSLFTSVYTYSFITFNLFLVIASTYIMLNRSDALKFLERDVLKKQYNLIVAGIAIALVVAVLPVAIMIFFKNDMTQTAFLLKGIAHFLIIWLLASGLAIVIGSSVSLLVRNQFAYLVSLGIYGGLVWMSVNSPDTPIKRYLNIFDDTTYIASNNLSGPLVNMNYLLDKLFVLFLILVLIFLVRSFLAAKRKVVNILLLAVCIASLGLLPVWGQSTLQMIEPPLNQTAEMENKYEIQQYNMDLDLGFQLKNKVTMTIDFSEDVKEIMLALDDIFVIKELQVDDEAVPFTHQNDMVMIASPHQKGEAVTLTLNYQGTVEMVNNLGFSTYYVTRDAINLPGQFFDWYPHVKGQNTIDFDVLVNAKTEVYSNIASSSNDQKHLSGASESLNIFAGQYQQTEVDGIQYTIPRHVHAESFAASFQTAVDQSNLSEDDLSTINNQNYEKVIAGIWPLYADGNSVRVVGDTVLVNYHGS